MLVFDGMSFTDVAAAKGKAFRIRPLADDVDRLLSGIVPSPASIAAAL